MCVRDIIYGSDNSTYPACVGRGSYTRSHSASMGSPSGHRVAESVSESEVKDQTEKKQETMRPQHHFLYCLREQ